MIKFYNNGKEFYADNQEILESYPLETSFYRLNSNAINSFTNALIAAIKSINISS